MKLLDDYKEDLAQYQNTHERKRVRRYWFRAVCETLFERQLTPLRYPKRKPSAYQTLRFKPNWRRLPEEELNELYLYLKPYFSRRENRDDNCS